MPATRVPQRRRRPWGLLIAAVLALTAVVLTTALGGFEPAATKLQGKPYPTKQEIKGARWAFLVDGAAITQDRYDDAPKVQVVFQASNRTSAESLFLPPDMLRLAVGDGPLRKADRIETEEISEGGPGLVTTYIASYEQDASLPPGEIPVRLVIWDEAPPKRSFLSSSWGRSKPLGHVEMTAPDLREAS